MWQMSLCSPITPYLCYLANSVSTLHEWRKATRLVHRLAVALRLLPQRFDLGFRALHAFCPAQTARIFAAVGGALAAQGRTAELRALLQNIQGLVTSDEWDQVCHVSLAYFPMECIDQPRRQFSRTY